MDLKLEVLTIPVSDVDRARDFYVVILTAFAGPTWTA